jgi:hypothetical protein
MYGDNLIDKSSITIKTHHKSFHTSFDCSVSIKSLRCEAAHELRLPAISQHSALSSSKFSEYLKAMSMDVARLLRESLVLNFEYQRNYTVLIYRWTTALLMADG